MIDVLNDLLFLFALGALLAALCVLVALRGRDGEALRLAERRVAEDGERLRAIELLSSIADQSSEIIFAKDLQGRYTFYNPEVERIFGLRKGKILGATVHDLLPAAEAVKTVEIEERVMRGNVALTQQETRELQGRTHTYLVTRKPLHDATGRVIGLFGMAKDVTHLEQGRASQALLAAIVESSADAIICQALDGTVTSANRAAEVLFGFSAAEAIGRIGATLSPGPRSAEIRDRIVAGEVVRIPHVLRHHRDGRELHVAMTLSPVLDEAGSVVAISAVVRDIGERVALERELRERGDALERAQAIARLGHLITRADGGVESCSHALAQLLQRSCGELHSSIRTWLGWIHPDERAGVRAQMQAAARSGLGVTFEYRMQRGDGAWIDIHHVEVPLEAANEAGHEAGHPGVARWLGTLQDVTAQKALEASLRESARFVQSVGDSMLSQMAVLDHRGVIVSVNASWRRFAEAQHAEAVGIARREDVGIDYLAVCRAAAAAEPDAAVVGAGLAAVLGGQRPCFTHEYECRSPSGGRWFLVTASPLRIDSGGALVLHTEITDRKRAETELVRHREHLEELIAERSSELVETNAALRDTENFLRTLADQLPGRVAYWNSDLTCAFVNKSYCEWYGKAPAELLGRTMREIFGEAFSGPREERVSAVLAGAEQHFEREETGAGGEQMVSWVHYIPDRLGTEVRGFIVLANNITEMKQAENSLRQANQELVVARGSAEAATVAKSAFLANMSHEIRTPMNAIIGLTHLLRRDVQEPAQRDRLGKVADAAQHLLGVINDILDLSKIESGKLLLDNAEFATATLLSRVCALVADQARSKGLPLRVEAAELPEAMHGDATRLSQALLNFLSNAVKFTERGAITLRGQVLERSADTIHVRFEVQDTGIGIAPQRLGDIFNAFEQADASTTRTFGGTGLGLAITRQLAQLMQGDAGVISTPGAGSTFWFTARLGLAARQRPALRTALAAAQAQAAPKPPGSAFEMLRATRVGARILLAEDNPVNQELAVELLSSAGLEIDVAGDGAEAVELGQRGGHDLILMDMQMPRLDGLEATRILRAGAACCSTPIVAMTANAFGDDRQACLDAGMNDHVAKPVDPETLYATLLRWLPERQPDTRSGSLDTGAAELQAPAAPADVLSRLAATGELDVARGLELFDGLSDLYLRVLRSYVESYAGGMQQLDETLRAHDAAGMMAAAHSLRGASASIGAARIQELAGDLEVLGKSGASADEMAPSAAALQASLAEVSGRIRAVLNAAH